MKVDVRVDKIPVLIGECCGTERILCTLAFNTDGFCRESNWCCAILCDWELWCMAIYVGQFHGTVDLSVSRQTKAHVMLTCTHGVSPNRLLVLWLVTDYDQHCWHVSINKIWRWTESTPRSGWYAVIWLESTATAAHCKTIITAQCRDVILYGLFWIHFSNAVGHFIFCWDQSLKLIWDKKLGPRPNEYAKCVVMLNFCLRQKYQTKLITSTFANVNKTNMSWMMLWLRAV